MKMSSRNRILWTLTVVFLVVCATLAILSLWPGDIAKIRCADGSMLAITGVVFATNQIGVRDNSRLPAATDAQSNLGGPSLRIWGVWRGRGKETHSFRFVTIAEGGFVTSTLKNQVEAFGPGKRSGL